MINGGIFGPKLSGKTTLAVQLSRVYWRQQSLRSLVLDPHKEAWGAQAWVTAEESEFWPVVWRAKSCLIVVEEAAATIRRERDLIPVFTRLRHCQHRLLVVGHSGMDLLPTMRQQIDTLYLFRQPGSAAKVWAENFADDGLLAAATLEQYEFIRKESYRPAARMRLDPKKLY